MINLKFKQPSLIKFGYTKVKLIVSDKLNYLVSI
jgi:hypothetical protein